jgi:hypothetical protein
LVGEIVRLVELGLDGERAALSAEKVCAVKWLRGLAATFTEHL